MNDLKTIQRVFEKVPGMEPETEQIDEMSIGLIDYLLKEQPPMLYTNSAACLAVFRELSPLAQNFILRLLFVDQAVPQAVVASWVKSGSEFKKASEVLTALHLLKAIPSQTGLPGFLLNDSFRTNFKHCFLGGGIHRPIFSKLKTDKHLQSIEALDDYAMSKRWDSILNHMACVRANTDSRDAIGESTRNVLAHARLVVHSTEDGVVNNGDNVEITAMGFQFLLMDISSQIWFFIRKFLEMSPRELFLERLGFLFELNFLTLGKSYSTEGMSSSMLDFLQELREMGLVYQRKRKDGRFYPTRLIVGLFESVRHNLLGDSFNQSHNAERFKRRGFIVVETNYRLYAYTDSPLQIALLYLFTELEYRFPNFVVGMITRDSVRMAFKNGITAKQITHYLTMHAHTQMMSKDRNTIIPATVIDQIFLWEQERNRLAFCEGVLYSQFNSFADFETMYKFAVDLGVILYENFNKRLLVVSPKGHESIRVFWKNHKNN